MTLVIQMGLRGNSIEQLQCNVSETVVQRPGGWIDVGVEGKLFGC